MRRYNPTDVDVRKLKRLDRFALLYNNHTDHAHCIADLEEFLPEFKRGGPVTIGGGVYIIFTRRKR